MTPPRMPVPGEWARLSPLIRRLTQDNPSVFTGAGTNTFIIGSDEVWILDPGPDDDADPSRPLHRCCADGPVRGRRHPDSDPDCAPLDYVRNEVRELELGCVMNNNFAFGGINTSLIFRRLGVGEE